MSSRRRAASRRPAVVVAWLRLSRPSDWVTSKLPFLAACTLWTAPEVTSVPSIVGLIAAVGDLVQAVAERAADARAGKANRAADLSGTSAALFLAVTFVSSGTLVLAGAPDLRAPALWLAAAGLSAAYSAPPLRLKERGFLGLLVAAAAQWALPVLFVSAAGRRAALDVDSWLLALLGLAIGVRWMAVHQALDASRDRISGVRTYASEGGAIAPVLAWAFRSELGLLLASLIASWPRSLAAAVALGLWALKSGIARGAGAGLRDGLTTYERAPLSDYYFLFLPVSLALGRATSDPELLVLVPLFLVLGAGQIARVLRELRPGEA